jgi:eukaryotic-like serine/threonine-protein kinase
MASQPYNVTWERWPEVDALFDRALDVPEHERDEFLSELSDTDPELCSAVRELLRASQRIPDGLLQPSGPLLRAAFEKGTATEPAGLRTGERIGRYQLIGELGRGGMAVVYEAERADGAFSRRVALKVLHGGLDNDEFVRRSLAERQILSGLAHPNIATLLDGGTTPDGRPFLVMELVRGDPITGWADERGLSVRARVRLFLQVVDAVGYAHTQLVVHRDLKPSNVLVRSDGQVKLLDFGVAKLLDSGEPSEDPLTRLTRVPMTPEFASPEQLRGERVTAVSDVYQLGVLLYSLLTGARPFASKQVRDRLMGAPLRVRRPSEVVSDRDRARSLRGDLDTIVLKALEPDPADRYRSAEALADDVRRFLEGRPIAARPASALLRVRKFGRRNAWFWPAAAVLTFGLSGYVATVVRYSDRLERERNQAVAHAERADAIQAFMINQFGRADPYSSEPVNPDVTVIDAMALGADAARRELADQPLLQAQMLSAIAHVYSNLSLGRNARSLLDEAMSIRRRLGMDDTPEQVEDLGFLGSILGREGERDSARVLLQKRVALERAMFGNEHPRTADALERMGWHWFEEGDYDRASASYEEAVSIRRASETPDAAGLSASLVGLADAHRALGRWEDARAAALEAYAISLEAFGEEHAVTAGNKGHLAQVVHGMGDLAYAETLYREALPVLERTLGEQHENTLANWNNLGIVLTQADDLEGAEQVQRRILQLRRERFGTDENGDVAASLQNLAALLVRQGRLTEADSLARRAEQIFSAIAGSRHYSVAFSLITQTDVALGRGLGSQAEQLVRRAIEILEPQFGPGYPTAAASCRLGRAFGIQGRLVEAGRIITASLEAMENAEGVPARQIASCRDALAELETSGNPPA